MTTTTSGNFGVGYRFPSSDDEKPPTRMELDEQVGRKANRTAVEELEKRVTTLEDQVLKLNNTIGIIQASQ